MADIARELGEDHKTLGNWVSEEHLTALVRRAAPQTLDRLGVGTHHAAQLLVTAGQNFDRLTTAAAFSHLCAADPIPASSGRAQRHCSIGNVRGNTLGDMGP
jgi:hypothetical protein